MNFITVSNLCRCRWLLLLLAFHGMEFLLLGQLVSAEPVMAPLNFGTSTLDRAPWRGDWRRQLMLGEEEEEEEVESSTSEQNRHRRRFLTLTAEQILHTECADDSSSSTSNGGGCVTRVEWRTHADYGRNRRKCHWQMARSSGSSGSSSSSGWQPFTFFQEGAHLTGLATPLHSISISAASNSNGQQQRRKLPAVEGGGGHLLLLLASSSARLMADRSLLQQIGRLLANAENVNGNGNGEWRKPNCSQRNGEGDQEGEEQESWLDVELATGQRIGISPRDLAVEYSDANGTCALSMAQFGQSRAEQLMPQARLAIALPMRHCLFLDLAKRQLAFVPRKWPHQQQQQQKLEQYLGGDNGIDGEEEERQAGGGQQRREVDTWLSFALSLI